MKYNLWSLIGWIIGPVVWSSTLSLMAYGLGMGEWYGYLLAAIFVAWGTLVWFVIHRARKFGEAEIRRMVSEWNANERGDEQGP